jgi:hypothetical protein
MKKNHYKNLTGEETDTTVTLETTPSSANITPSQSGELTATPLTSSADENSCDVTLMSQSQHLPPKNSSPFSSMTK